MQFHWELTYTTRRKGGSSRARLAAPGPAHVRVAAHHFFVFRVRQGVAGVEALGEYDPARLMEGPIRVGVPSMSSRRMSEEKGRPEYRSVLDLGVTGPEMSPPVIMIVPRTRQPARTPVAAMPPVPITIRVIYVAELCRWLGIVVTSQRCECC